MQCKQPLGLLLFISNVYGCTALPRTEFLSNPRPDTQRKRRRGERETGVTKGSYLLLTSLSSPLPPSPLPRRAPTTLPEAALSGHTPPFHSTFP